MGVTSPEAPNITYSGRLTHILLIVCFEEISKQTIISCSTSMHPGEGALWAYESFDHLRIFQERGFIPKSCHPCILILLFVRRQLLKTGSKWMAAGLFMWRLPDNYATLLLPASNSCKKKTKTKKTQNLSPQVLFMISPYIASTVQTQRGIFFKSLFWLCANKHVFCCTTLLFFCNLLILHVFFLEWFVVLFFCCDAFIFKTYNVCGGCGGEGDKSCLPPND